MAKEHVPLHHTGLIFNVRILIIKKNYIDIFLLTKNEQ